MRRLPCLSEAGALHSHSALLSGAMLSLRSGISSYEAGNDYRYIAMRKNALVAGGANAGRFGGLTKDENGREFATSPVCKRRGASGSRRALPSCLFWRLLLPTAPMS